MRLAESWTLQSTSANAVDGGTFTTGQILAVPDGGQTQLQFSYGGSVRTESAEITLTIEPLGGVDHQPGDLSLVLVSPSGTESTIFNRPGFYPSGDPDSAETFFGGSETLTFTFRSEAFRGESSQGIWTLRAEDHNANGLQAVITGIAFTAHGGLPRTDDIYVFTDEFGTTAAPHGAGSTVTLTDGGGIDTLNAAAVSGAADIDLGPGQTSTVASGSFEIDGATLFENAIGGDGDDTLTGNAQTNLLSGMRGDDTLSGGDGNDTLTGGPGADSLHGGTGVDVASYQASAGAVTVDLQTGSGSGGDAEGDTLDGIENAAGSENDDTLMGSIGANHLLGGDGDDVLRGDHGLTFTVTDSTLVNGLGGPAGFGEAVFDGIDDSVLAVGLVTPFKLGGTTYADITIDRNGRIIFGSGPSDFSATQVEFLAFPLIAPFWADAQLTGLLGIPSPGGNSTGADAIFIDVVGGDVTVTWDDVRAFGDGTDTFNAFQVQLLDRGGGDFDVVFRYEDMNWNTATSSVNNLAGISDGQGQSVIIAQETPDGGDDPPGLLTSTHLATESNIGVAGA